jgi:DNA-directed RNA polymerase subunit alpha
VLGGFALDEVALPERGWARFEAPSSDGDPGSESSGTASVLDRSVDELELSVRTASSLQSMGILTIRELVQKSEVDMLESKNFGLKSLIELKELLAEMGLSFGMRLS